MNHSKKSLLPTLFAVGTGIAAAPASAIELGEVNIQSTIGQPLRASIAYALGPNEQLADYCVTLNPGQAAAGLPAITRAGISVANGIIALSGASVIREPLMTLRVDINCPYTPTISREYMLFINPASLVSETAVEPQAAAAPIRGPRSTISPAPQAASTAVVEAQAPAPRRVAKPAPKVDPASQYRVQRGDTLSEIAARIEDRPIGLWAAVAEIFDANPEAFIDNDPDKLKAGSLLTIPEFGAGKSFSVSAPAAIDAAVSTADIHDTATGAAIVDDASAGDQTVESTIVDDRAIAGTGVTDAAEDTAVDPVIDDTEVLAPATQSAATDAGAEVETVEYENPFVVTDAPEVVIPDTELEAPTTAGSPNVPTANISVPIPQPAAESSTSWLLWLVGGGVALILGLLLFGRRNRKPAYVGPIAGEEPRRSYGSENAASAAQPAHHADDHALHDDAPTEENLALDADLDVGTGLRDTGMHVYEDFGFATETNLDIELPEDEEYDMSVITDATKLQGLDEASQRDLKAVLVEGEIDNDATDNYTIDQEIDYQILEQDYQNELTATQALNVEIEKAAAEVAKGMDQRDIDDLTSELHLASITEIDATASLPADEIDTDDTELQLASVADIDATAHLPADEIDTDNTEEITAANEELTLEEMVSEDFTVEMPREDDTVQMPRKTSSK